MSKVQVALLVPVAPLRESKLTSKSGQGMHGDFVVSDRSSAIQLNPGSHSEVNRVSFNEAFASLGREV
jgi:hypothetical protein